MSKTLRGLTKWIVYTVGLTLAFALFTHLFASLAPETVGGRPIIWFAGAGGIALLLIFGRGYWPAVGIGWLISYYFRSDSPFTTMIAMAIVITFSCWAAVRFLDAYKFDRALCTPRDLVLLGISLLGGATINLVGLSLVFGVFTDWNRFAQWLLSYGAGAVMLLPVVLSWLYGGRFGDAKRWAHFLLCIGVTVAVCIVADHFAPNKSFQTFHFLPLMVWASLAFNLRGATVVMAIIHAFAYWQTIDFSGPVLEDQVNRFVGIAVTQQYIIISGFTVLVLAALADHSKEAARLADREQRLASIVNTAEDGILVVTKEGIIDDMNPAAERMFGYSMGEAKGRKAESLFDGGARIIANTSTRFGRRADGSQFPAQITIGVWTNKEGREFNTKIVRDITRQQRAEAELADREERYRAIVETAVDGIIVINSAGIIQSFNRAADEMFGYDLGETIGQPVTMLMHEAERESHDEAIRHHEATGEKSVPGTAGVVVEACRKDGSSFPAHLAIAEWFVGGERFYTGIMRDLTKQKASEDARDILAREVDHRAKNALAVVQSLVRLTRAKTVQEFTEAVSGRIEALARAHSLLSQGNWSGVLLSQIAEDELAVAAKGSDVTIKGNGVRLTPDAVQPVSMLFHELATNAFKYGALRTPEGGVKVEWKVSGKQLIIEWIEEGEHPVEAPDSSGFGSRMMKQVVTKQLEGTLDYDWRPEGLHATIKLPQRTFIKVASVPAPKVPAPLAEPLAGEGRRVLIVEDNAVISMELESSLEDAGYNVVGRANSVVEALSVIDTTEIDVAVLDVDLGGEQSFPIADALTAKGVPYAFATGFESLTKEKGYDAPVLTKPVNEAALRRTLDRLRDDE